MTTMGEEELWASLGIPTVYTFPDDVAAATPDALKFLRKNKFNRITLSPAMIQVFFSKLTPYEHPTPPVPLTIVVPENNNLNELIIDTRTEAIIGPLPKLKVFEMARYEGTKPVLKVLPDMPALRSIAGLKNSDITVFNAPPTLRFIARECFYGTMIKTVSLPPLLTSLGPSAFQESELETIVLPTNKDFTALADNLFTDSALSNIVIPAQVKEFDKHVFMNCNILKSVDFEQPAQLVEIGTGALAGLFNLETITIPSTVIRIGEIAFKYSNLSGGLMFEEHSQLRYLGRKVFLGTSLEVLDLSHCRKLDNFDGSNLGATECKRLKKIVLPVLNAEEEHYGGYISTIAESCPELEEIHLGSFNKSEVKYPPFTNCPKVRLLKGTSIKQFEGLYKSAFLDGWAFGRSRRTYGFSTGHLRQAWYDHFDGLQHGFVFDFGDNAMDQINKVVNLIFPEPKTFEEPYETEKALDVVWNDFIDEDDPDNVGFLPKPEHRVSITWVETRETSKFGIARRRRTYGKVDYDNQLIRLQDEQPLVDEPFKTNVPLILTAMTGEEFEITDGWNAPNGDIIAEAKRQHPEDLAEWDFTLAFDGKAVDPKTFTLHTLAAMLIDNKIDADSDGIFLLVHADSYEPPDAAPAPAPASAAGGTKRKRSSSLSRAFLDLTL
jgi:hypothetical protein